MRMVPDTAQYTPEHRSCGHGLGRDVRIWPVSESRENAPGMYPQIVSSKLSQKSFPMPNLAATAVYVHSDT